MFTAQRNKVTFQTRIRPELLDQVDQISKDLGIPKTKLTQMALGDLCYKILGKLPKAQAEGGMEHFDPESLTDVFIHSKITGVWDYSALGYYLDIDLPKESEKEAD